MTIPELHTAFRESQSISHTPHNIGWLVAAVPTDDGETFWGYTSVPDAGVKWWDSLPVLAAEGR